MTGTALGGGIGRACVACDTANGWNRRFCRACGAKIVAACGDCDFGNAIADLFCGGCGSALQAGAQASDAALPPSAPLPPASPQTGPQRPPPGADPAALALARKLSALNSSNVQAQAKIPPPVPSASKEDESTADDLGQEQIDVLFG
ncbi:MAG: hypothetical protein GY811_01645 [Myxococcales bacterium]|nr:hypothetical protein [Myxococcales bacterium]